MPYTPVDFSRVRDPLEREIFERANAYLADVYTMLHARPRRGSRGGECNFTSALTLACVIDALSIYVYPKGAWAQVAPCSRCGQSMRDQMDAKKRFKRIV